MEDVNGTQIYAGSRINLSGVVTAVMGEKIFIDIDSTEVRVPRLRAIVQSAHIVVVKETPPSKGGK